MLEFFFFADDKLVKCTRKRRLNLFPVCALPRSVLQRHGCAGEEALVLVAFIVDIANRNSQSLKRVDDNEDNLKCH